MKKSLKLLLLVCVMLAVAAFAGCKKESPTQKAGEKADTAAEKTGDALKAAGEKTGDALKKAGDAVKNTTK